MALSNIRYAFGVHSFAPYNRSTGEFYGIARVLGGSSVSLSGSLVKLEGGSSKYPWAVEDSTISAEVSLKVKQYEDFMFELFLGKAPTAVGVDAAGTVSSITDKYGTSVVASTGLASVSVIPTTGAADLKFGKYVVKAASATTIDLYVSSNIDFARGTDADYQSDLLKVTSSPLTITTGGNTDMASFGLRFVGGAGVIAFVTGDTATFEVLPPSSASMSVSIGATSDVFPEFGAIMYAKKAGDLSMWEIDALRCKGVGMPLGLEENKFSEAEIKAEAFYDSSQNAVLKLRHINLSS